MEKGEFYKSILKPVIEWVIKKILPWLVSFLAGLVTISLLIKNKLVEHPYVLLILLTIMTVTTTLFFILWIRIYWRYGRFQLAFGVSWDKNYNMRCSSCKKPLKESTTSPSLFFCSDPKCDSKYPLKDNFGTEITKQMAIISLMQTAKHKKRKK